MEALSGCLRSAGQRVRADRRRNVRPDSPGARALASGRIAGKDKEPRRTAGLDQLRRAGYAPSQGMRLRPLMAYELMPRKLLALAISASHLPSCSGVRN